MYPPSIRDTRLSPLTITLHTGEHFKVVSRNGDNVRFRVVDHEHGIYGDYEVAVDMVGPDDR